MTIRTTYETSIMLASLGVSQEVGMGTVFINSDRIHTRYNEYAKFAYLGKDGWFRSLSFTELFEMLPDEFYVNDDIYNFRMNHYGAWYTNDNESRYMVNFSTFKNKADGLANLMALLIMDNLWSLK